MSTSTYPRPDFQRPDLNWHSLNGPWDFLFDDEDVGSAKLWQYSGLPAEVELTARSSNDPQWTGSEAESITQKIAALPDKLIQNNAFTRSSVTKNAKRTIQVPFVFQSPASGINERSSHEVLWYERSITDLRTAEGKDRGERLLLRFGAVDYHAKVWLDGQFVGEHIGGHVPFDVDLSDAVAASNAASHRLTIRVFDSSSDLAQPRGKQYWGAKPESIFYTPSSGIWQNVWLESVPSSRIADGSGGLILRSNDIDSGTLHAHVNVLGRRAGQQLAVEVEAHLAGVPVSKSDKKPLSKESSAVTLDLPMRLSKMQLEQLSQDFTASAPPSDPAAFLNGVALWSPAHPTLYNLTIRLYAPNSPEPIDTIETTTGMRHLSWHNPSRQFHLNHRPIFQALNLDQGYWPETFMTPPTPEALKRDIELAQAMGFNGCRKHQKVEDPLFLYYADRLGYLVWGEIANAYVFSPTYVERMDQEWREAMRRDINHPCIITWTPVNESWGYNKLQRSIVQRNHIRSLVAATHALDGTRPVNDNCGWEHVAGDLLTFHDYADAPELKQTCSSLAGICGPKAGRGMFAEEIKPLDYSDMYKAQEDGNLANAPDAPFSIRDTAPIICTEFGGVNIAPVKKGGDGGNELDWGYTTASDPEDLLKRFDALVQAVVGGGLCSGFVYTQIVDVEQEVNGLYSFDRQAKLEPSKVKSVIDRAIKGWEDRLKA